MNPIKETFMGCSIQITPRASGKTIVYDYAIANSAGKQVAWNLDFPSYDSALDQAEERIIATLKPFNHQ